MIYALACNLDLQRLRSAAFPEMLRCHALSEGPDITTELGLTHAKEVVSQMLALFSLLDSEKLTSYVQPEAPRQAELVQRVLVSIRQHKVKLRRCLGLGLRMPLLRCRSSRSHPECRSHLPRFMQSHTWRLVI